MGFKSVREVAGADAARRSDRACKGWETRRARIQNCVLCGKSYGEYGNNPDPVKTEGECCDHCNTTVVIPARCAQLGI